MNEIFKVARGLHRLVQPGKSRFGRRRMMPSKEYASELITSAIVSSSPSMISRLGANELQCMINHLGVQKKFSKTALIEFICNRGPAWWWNENIAIQMQRSAGFSPPTNSNLERFSVLMRHDLTEIDILGSWLLEEDFFETELRQAKRVMLEDLEPFFVTKPWTQALKGLRVLVVHPFRDSILSQYEIKDKVFPEGLLPDFDLEVIKAVQGLDSQAADFNWFHELDKMKSQIADSSFDVCIIGCGAFGLPLAAFVKGQGKRAVHLGGVTQMLFGIRGNRWERSGLYPYSNLFNEHWVRPRSSERPDGAGQVEEACYW